jgi:hypothetical protein
MVLASGQAGAHAVDGGWCRNDRFFVIRGPWILTWGGTYTTGEYSRRSFRYTSPATDEDAGSEIEMHLHSATTIEVFRRRPGSVPRSGPGRIWTRCRVLR